MQRIPAPVIMDAGIIYNLPGCGDFCTLATNTGYHYEILFCVVRVICPGRLQQRICKTGID